MPWKTLVINHFNLLRSPQLFFSVMVAGASSLFITGFWQGLVIRNEMRRDEADGEDAIVVQESEEADSSLVTELSWVWVGFGVVTTSVHAGLNIALSSTGNSLYESLSDALLPIALVCYCVSFYAKPRSDGLVWFLVPHFISFAWVGEGTNFVNQLLKDDISVALTHLGALILETIIFCYSLKVSV